MKKYLLFVLLFCTTSAFSDTMTQRDSIKMLSKQVAELQNDAVLNKSAIATLNNSTSNVLASINTSFVIIGVVVAICAVFVTIGVVFLSIHINNRLTAINRASEEANRTIDSVEAILNDADVMLRGTETMLSDTQDTLDQTIEIKEQVQDLSDKIHNNISQLYKELQDEELDVILNTLINNPEHFDVYVSKLYSRHTIPSKYLDRLIKVTLLLKEGNQRVGLGLIEKYFGYSAVFENDSLFEIFDKMFSGKTLTEQVEIADYLSARFKADNLSENESHLMTGKIFPLAEQVNLEPNLMYEKLIAKFDHTYIFSHIKKHLTLDDLKPEYVLYRKTLPDIIPPEEQQAVPWGFKPYLEGKGIINPQFNVIEAAFRLNDEFNNNQNNG